MSHQQKDTSKPQKTRQKGLILMGMGFELIGATLASVWIGRLVDEKLQTAPWGMMILVLLSVGLGLFHLVYVANKINRNP